MMIRLALGILAIGLCVSAIVVGLASLSENRQMANHSAFMRGASAGIRWSTCIHDAPKVSACDDLEKALESP